MQKSRFLVVLFLLISINVAGQEAGEKEAKAHAAMKGTHRLSLLVGHSHVSEGIMDNNKRGWKVIPSWGFNYDYWVSNHWAVGLQNDVIIETFKVEDHENVVIERTRPVLSLASVVFKPKEHVGFVAGMGGEFAKEHNFTVTRLGIESGWEMKSAWEFGVAFSYDIKWSGYDTWVIGFSISKLFKNHREAL